RPRHRHRRDPGQHGRDRGRGDGRAGDVPAGGKDRQAEGRRDRREGPSQGRLVHRSFGPARQGAWRRGGPAGLFAPVRRSAAEKPKVRGNTMTYDIVIRGGRIVDGTGSAAFTGDVAIADGKIAAIGEVAETGKREIAADGLTVTPGFVDIHTHL